MDFSRYHIIHDRNSNRNSHSIRTTIIVIRRMVTMIIAAININTNENINMEQ